MMPHKPLKPGEVLASDALCADASVAFVGQVRTPWTHTAHCPKTPDPEGPECLVEMLPAFVPALEGIERFDWIEVLMWFHHARRDLLVIAPSHAPAPRGVFALRSPVRPNPVAVSRVRLVRRDGARLIVRGLDAVDGTPLIDIKPSR